MNNDHHEGRCIRIDNGFLTIGGTTREIEIRGKIYYFEMHRYCGPMAQNKNGEERKTPWPMYVWNAVQLWIDQGKQMDGDRCVYSSDHEVIEEKARARRASNKDGAIVPFKDPK